MFPAVLGILLTACIIRYPVLNALHVTPPDFVESLSIPTQQIASVLAHDRTIDKEQLSLGLAYPGDYMKAYINQTYGYWYPDSFYPVADGEGISATSLGVSHTPLIGGPLIIKGKEISLKLGGMLPIYSLLWSMGIAFWFLLFCIGNAFARNEKAKLICYLPSFALFLTVMIATPVATDFRYVYFMVFSVPFYLMCALISPDC